MKSVDVLISGAGPVGLTLALALARRLPERQIAVVEKNSLSPIFDHTPDARVSALNHHSEQLLTNLGVWPQLARKTAYQRMEVWEKDSFAHIDFSAQLAQRNQLGHIVENQVLVNALLTAIRECSNILTIEQAAISELDQGKNEVFVRMGDSTMSAALVVGAEGVQSTVKGFMNAPDVFWDYGQQAIVANIETELPHDAVARQVFTPHGPLALLPQSEPNLCSIVFSQDSLVADELMALAPAEFDKALTVAAESCLGRCRLQGQRAVFPLEMRYARSWLDGSLVLVGDSAHRIHPLAGLGLNLGLGDVSCLVEQVVLNAESGDLNGRRRLRMYERARKAEAVKTIAAMQGFKTLFAGDAMPKKLIRGLGLAGVDRLAQAKQFFLQQAL